MKSILRLTALTNWNQGLSGHKTASQNELASFWQIKQKGGCELFPIKLQGGKCSHRPWLSKASQSVRIRPRHLYPLWCTALIEVNKESLKAHPWRRRKEWFNKKDRQGEEMAGWWEPCSLETLINIWLVVIRLTPSVLSGSWEELKSVIV